jgi:hypothetical protein
LTVACRVEVAPTATDADVGETVTVVTTGGGGVFDKVEAATTFERSPNTAFPVMLPRNATSWKL